MVTVGIFILGAGAGGLGVLLHQMVLRAKLQNEIEDQLKKALFDPIRRNRVAP
jgi:hypothetical protein